MVDGDDTYPASQAAALCAPVLEGRADMVIGDRLSLHLLHGKQKKTPFRYDEVVQAHRNINGKVFFVMGTKAHSLAHTKWLCKYHIVFTPKYRRKIIFTQLRESIKRNSAMPLQI